LEDSESAFSNHPPVLRAGLELHRTQPLCASCHNRLDPPGLALENFNAMGMFRDQERGQTIEAGGQLITGEKFANIQELKHILANQHRADFYRCLTEKLLTYALGRGLEDYDVETVDRIVERMEKQDGRFSALLLGVIESAPFEKRRAGAAAAGETPPKPAPRRAVLN
jgi:mannose-6-phosphate isomerase class I